MYYLGLFSLETMCLNRKKKFTKIFSIFLREGRLRIGAPDGGDGGDGGGVVFVADSTVRTLAPVKPQYRAKGGGRGTGNYQSGSKGRDVIVKVTYNSAL